MEEADHRPHNPYTELEGYEVLDNSGTAIGRVERTVYDAPSDVLKYIVVGGRAIPAESAEVNPDGEQISVPYDRELVESAPELESPPSGEFDEALRRHYGA